MTIKASIPDDKSFQAGDRVQLEGRVLEDGSILVTKAVMMPDPQRCEAALSLTEWVKRYSGSMHLSEDETRESLRDSFLLRKFGE